jgi:hypothetical protein
MEDETGGVHVMYGREHKRIRVLENKSETNRRLAKYTEEITKLGLKGIGCEDMDWNNMGLDRKTWQSVVNTVMNFGFP